MNKLLKVLLALSLAAPVFAQSSGLPSRVTGTVGNCVKIGTNNIATDNGAVCGTGTGTSVSQNSGSAETSLAVTGFMPQVCSDTSASGTAQTCTVANSFTPQAGNCIVYKTTTANSGTGLTVNVDSLGAKSVAVPGSSGWTTTLVASSSIPANKPMNLCYDGTNWNASGTGFAASGSGALTLISTLTPTGTGTVTFSSLGSYRDLIVVVRGAGTAAASFSEVHMQFNSDTGSNYDLAPITVNNTSLATTPVLAGTYFQIGWVPAATGVTNMGSDSECTIYDYAGTTFQKSIEARSGIKLSNAVSNFFKTDSSGWWRNTAAITSVTVFLDGGNYATGSSVSLYGRN